MFTCSLGEGIELRLLEERHAEELFCAVDRNRGRLRPWLNWVDRTLSAEDCRGFIRMALAQFAAREAMHVGIWEGRRLIGGSGHHRIDWVSRNTSIGYWLDAAAEGRGVVTRTCEALLNHLFGELRLHRVEIRCATANTRSAAVPARLGFTREGILRQAEWAGDRYNDLVVWSILADEWEARTVRRPFGPRAGA
ncbi:MAG TPA: GNAT family protein [Bryobacteraceae bacterium]|nr:GNAT family protein [Bryobacteraceae bacterium]